MQLLNESKKYLPSGSGSEPKKQWAYYKEMQFFIKFLDQRPLISSINYDSNKVVPEHDSYAKKRILEAT